jgi:STE24 endopeptidase
MKSALLSAYVLTCILDQILEWLNLRHQQRHAGKIPRGFEGHFDRQTVKRALAYETDKKRLALAGEALSAVLFIGFMFGGLLPRYDSWIADLSDAFIVRGVIFFLGLLAVRMLLDLPFSWLRNFRIEARYGFNTMTPRLWLTDAIKGFVLSSVLYGLLIAGALWLVSHRPATWWLWVWGFVTLFGLFVMVISPYVIEPLFFKFSPVQKPALERRIRQLAEKAGLHARRIFQVDASRRSRHGNAYFTGLGRQKRIVLFDTLLEQMNDDQTLAVLAHEIGHWKHKHITKRLLSSILLSLGGFYLASLLIRWENLPSLLGLEAASFPARLMILGLLFAIVTFLLAPVGHALSRRHEWQADHFACKLTGKPADLAEALIKLARENLAALHPHPLYALVRFSHPPIVERVRALLNRAGSTMTETHNP